MRTSKLRALLFTALCCLALSQRTEAATGYSDLNHNELFNTVDGYSETQLSFPESYYYNAVVDAYLYDQFGNELDHGYAEGGSHASVRTRAAAWPGRSYHLFSDHYVGAYFYYCDYYCDTPRYQDECGFSSFYPADTFYGSFYEYGCYSFCYVFYYYIYLGTTGDSVSVPQPCPDTTVEIRATFGGSGAPINGTTKPALVGAFVQLEALAITPEEGPTTDGNFQWSADGGARTPPNDFPLPTYIYRVFWAAEGTKKVTVKYTPPGSSCQVSASVNINVTTPSLVSFTGHMHDDEINSGAGCSTLEGTTYTLGCATNQPGGRMDAGITFTAKVQPPAGYISAPDEGKVKFVQLINPYSRRRQRGASADECQTLRGTFTSTEWMLDTSDPYDPFPRAVKSFASVDASGMVTIETNDSPGYILDHPSITLDYLFSDDLFEMYVVYFTGDARNPLVSRTLGYLPWTWGGEVVADFSLNPPYRQTLDFTVPGPKQGFSAPNYRQPYQGNVRDMPYGPCPGDSEPPPDPWPDPCWNGSYYVCE